MIALYIILGIIALFVTVLSIPVSVEAAYDEYLTLKIKYLFVKLNILPIEDKPKKPKKKKPSAVEKKPAKKPEQKKETEQTGEKKKNPLVDMLKANGYDGLMQIFSNLARYTGRFGKAFAKAFHFKNITVHVAVGTGDAASTAIEYGKACRKVFPVTGFVCANCLTDEYDVWVEPDFLANRSEGEFYTRFHICGRRIINGGIAYVFRILFGVGVRFILNATKKDKSGEEKPSGTGGNQGAKK